MPNNPVVLLTAAVTPQAQYLQTGSSFPTALADPQVRLAQYVRAIQRWQQIVAPVRGSVAVVETSGYELQALREAAGGTVEMVSYTPSDEQVDRGRGSIEAAAIDHALSELGRDTQSLLVKVTGRLVVANAVAAMTGMRPGTVRVRRQANRVFADSRFLITDVGTWTSHLTGMASQVDDEAGRWLERVLAVRLFEAEVLHGLTVERFPVIPAIEGQSGTTGELYTSRWDTVPAVRLLQRKAEGVLAHAARFQV